MGDNLLYRLGHTCITLEVQKARTAPKPCSKKSKLSKEKEKPPQTGRTSGTSRAQGSAQNYSQQQPLMLSSRQSSPENSKPSFEGAGQRKIKSILLTTSSVNMTSSSSTGGMGSAGSMVCRAKLLSLRSRYVISGWSLLRKQQKMKEIPRPLLFLGAMAKILCVPPSRALDPEGKRREEA